MERVSKTDLLGFLDLFDQELKRSILLIAVGGTAMTLLGLKSSTKDVDFNIPSEEDYNEFKRIKEKIKPGITIDFWSSNTIFSEILPDNYVGNSTKYKASFKNIDVRILSPIDILCSKISRFNDADREDIKDCIKHAKITKSQLTKRAGQYSRAGSDDIFKQNLEYILENMF